MKIADSSRSSFILHPSSFLLVLLCAAVATAQLPTPRIDRLQPLGVAAGGEVELELVGNDLDEAQTLLFARGGFTATATGANKFKVAVAADVPSGTYDVWTVGKYGISNPRLLTVSRGLTETVEKEPNDVESQAQEIAVHTAVTGLFDGDNVDWFRISLAARKRVTFDLHAMRLDTRLDGNLLLVSPAGKLLAMAGDYFGRDPLLDFVAPADGAYLLAVHDLMYRGGLPYRLVVCDRPHLENAFPVAVEPGKPTEVTILGRNLGAGSKPSSWSIGGLAFDEVRTTVHPPADPNLLETFTFLEHPSDLSGLPSAATWTLRGFQLRPALAAEPQNVVNFIYASSPPVVEAEPNDDQEHAQHIPLPATVNGRFQQPRDADWYTFDVPQGQSGTYTLEVYGSRIGGRCDPYLWVVRAEGGDVGEQDDFGPRLEAFEGKHRDPFFTTNLDEKKSYRLLVGDRSSAGGARQQYVLSIRKLDVDFHAAVIHAANQHPLGTTVARGGAAYLDVIVQHDGPNRPAVTVTAENLPPGLHAAPAVVRDDQRGVLVLWADADAPEWAGPLSLVATAEVAGKVVRRPVAAFTKVWEQGQGNTSGAFSSRPVQAQMAAIRGSAPLALRLEPERVSLAAGGKVELKLVAARLWPEAKGAVNVAPLHVPNRFKPGKLTVAEGASEAVVSLEVEKGVAPGDYVLTYIGDVQVPFHRDANAKEKPLVKATAPLRPLLVTVMPEAK